MGALHVTRSGLVLLFALACGARTGLDEDPQRAAGQGEGGEGVAGGPVTCADEELGRDTYARSLAFEGESLFWGAAEGQIFAREAGSSEVQLGQGPGSVHAIAPRGDRVYAISGNALGFVVRSGGPFNSLFIESWVSGALVPAGDDLLALNEDDGTLVAITPDDARHVVATGLFSPRGLTVDGDGAYVIVGDTPSGGAGVVRIELSGGATTMLVSGLPTLAGIGVDASYVYFMQQVDAAGELGGGLYRLPKNGGAIEVVAQLNNVLPLALAVDASAGRVFFTVTTSPAQGGVGSLEIVGTDGSQARTVAQRAGASLHQVALSTARVASVVGYPGEPAAGSPSVLVLCKDAL